MNSIEIKKLLVVVLCVACILSVVFVSGCTTNASPNETINESLQHIEQNQQTTNSLLALGLLFGTFGFFSDDK